LGEFHAGELADVFVVDFGAEGLFVETAAGTERAGDLSDEFFLGFLFLGRGAAEVAGSFDKTGDDAFMAEALYEALALTAELDAG